MNKEKRLSIIKEYKEKSHSDRNIEDIISSFAYEELTYAAIISRRKDLDLDKEFNKIIETYNFNFNRLSLEDTLAPRIKYFLNNPEIAAMQHCFINYISYLREFYDGTPCGEGKPFHTFDLEWVG